MNPMYYCVVFVHDRRCISRINSRVKYCNTLAECEKWVKTIKNRTTNRYSVRVIENNVKLWYTYELNIETK